MPNARNRIAEPSNESVLSYGSGTGERTELHEAIRDFRGRNMDIPCIVGVREISSGQTKQVTAPHDHSCALGVVHQANEDITQQAIEASLGVQSEWCKTDWYERASIFLKAADLLAGPWWSMIRITRR